MTCPRGSAGGTYSPCSRSQRCAKAISSFCATTMRSHNARSDGLASCEAAHPAILIACAWWPIIPARKCTSAGVYFAAAAAGATGATGATVLEGRGGLAHAEGMTTAGVTTMEERTHHRPER